MIPKRSKSRIGRTKANSTMARAPVMLAGYVQSVCALTLMTCLLLDIARCGRETVTKGGYPPEALRLAGNLTPSNVASHYPASPSAVTAVVGNSEC